MPQLPFEQTKIGRSYAALHEWWETQHVRGDWHDCAKPWESHPSWSSAADRDRWHRNWAELLNFHTTVHIRKLMVNGVTRFKLRIRVTHPDRDRLELVRSVAGGTIEGASGPRTVCRLEIETLGAFLALKAGRFHADPANEWLMHVLDAAMDFYEWVPERGEPASDEQMAKQEDCMDRLDALMGGYVSLRRAPHDCQEGIRRAGMADWSAPEPQEGPRYDVF